MGATRREPSDLIYAENGYWAETACVAQILYMHGRWDGSAGPGQGISLAALDERIGRAPLMPDLAGGCLRVLLEEGFHIRHITGDDLILLATSTDYLRDKLLAEGRESAEFILAKLDEWAPMVQARNTARLALYEQYQAQVELVAHPSSWSDVDDLVDAGWIVGIATVNTDGTNSARLITAHSDTGRYHVYSPQGPHVLAWFYRSVWADDLAQGVYGYRLP